MNLNNQSSLQISEENKFLKNIKQYYEVCLQIVEINDYILRFLPSVIQPFRSTFQELININVTQRQKREQISVHLTSAYYSASTFQRQTYMQQSYYKYLSKLRQVPAKVKLLSGIDNLRKQIQFSLHIIQKSTYSSLQKGFCQQVSNNIINPNQVIKQCENNILILKNMQSYYINQQDKQSKLQYKSSFLQLNDLQSQKNQLKQQYSRQQFCLEENFVKIILWKYQACVLSSMVILQKSSKIMGIAFIKYSKSIIKSQLIQIETIAKLYCFCLKNIIKKQTWIQNDQEHIYFQLELKKILHKYKNEQLTAKVISEVDAIFIKIKEKVQNEVFKSFKHKKTNDRNMNNKMISNSTNQFISEHSFQEMNVNSLNIISSSLHEQQQKSKSIFNRYNLHSKFKFRFNQNNSQSLRKIKQYQLSLRKSKQQVNQFQTQNNKICQTFRNESIQNEINPKFSLNNKNSLFKSKRAHHQVSLILQKAQFFNNKTKIINLHNNKQKNNKNSNIGNHILQKTTSKIYLSIKDKVSRQMSITVKGLENEMFMVPQFIYQKPKITFEEILNDAKTMQQRQNESESNVANQTVSQIYIQKIQVDLDYFFMMNYEIYSFKIKKHIEYSEQFSCTISNSINKTKSKIKFQQSQLFTFRSIRNIIETTDLFFQLIQIGIKGFKVEPTLALALNIKNLNQLEKTDHLGYYAYANCLNYIVQIGNYIQPYVYWYFTKRSKINGTILQKRPKIQMSDPLKFSINLQFFKKNDFAGCIQLFQAVRNKKGLRQCLNYLSQGREIICRYLAKQNNAYFIETVQFHSKYLNFFEISESGELIFSLLKIYVKKYEIKQQIIEEKTKLISKVLNLMDKNNFKKAKKKRSQKTQKVQQIKIRKLNMKQIFTNYQCNRILVNNLNKNYVEKRHIQKIIKFIKFKCSEQVKQIDFKHQNDKKSEQIGEDNKLNITLQGQKQHIFSPQNKETNMKSNYKKMGTKPTSEELMQKVFNQLANLQQESKILIIKEEGQQCNNNRNISESKYKFLSLALNSKYKNFQFFIAYLTQVYNTSLMLKIRKQKLKKIKILNRFYEIVSLKFFNSQYMIILKDNLNSKQWIMYLSEQILRNIDFLTFRINQFEQSISSINSFKEREELEIRQSNTIKININFNSVSNSNKKQSSQDLSELSIKSMKSEDIWGNNANKKINLLFFQQIFNDQSKKFHFTFMESPFYNQFAIKRYNSEIYFNNSSSKCNKFSICQNHSKIVFKKVMKSRDEQKKIIYYYISCSLDMTFKFWKLNIYIHKSQQNFSVFVPFNFISSNELTFLLSDDEDINFDITNLKQTKSKFIKYKQLWNNIILTSFLKMNSQNQFINLKNHQFKMYETFGDLTLPTFQNAQENYFHQLEKKSLKQIQKNQQKQKNTSFNYLPSKNSGKVNLIKFKDQVNLILFNYQKRIIFKNEVQQNPNHIFANIFSEFSFKQSKYFLYQNLFRRLFQKIERNAIVLEQIRIQDL